jgi:hypothetical protein
MALPHPAAAAAHALRCCTVGFPRIGARRELKFALEAFWAGASRKEELLAAAHAAEAAALKLQRDVGALRRELTCVLHVVASSAARASVSARIRAVASRRGVGCVASDALARASAALQRCPPRAASAQTSARTRCPCPWT